MYILKLGPYNVMALGIALELAEIVARRFGGGGQINFDPNDVIGPRS